MLSSAAWLVCVAGVCVAGLPAPACFDTIDIRAACNKAERRVSGHWVQLQPETYLPLERPLYSLAPKLFEDRDGLGGWSM